METLRRLNIFPESPIHDTPSPRSLTLNESTFRKLCG
jgi:hypothetical protein